MVPQDDRIFKGGPDSVRKGTEHPSNMGKSLCILSYEGTYMFSLYKESILGEIMNYILPLLGSKYG